MPLTAPPTRLVEDGLPNLGMWNAPLPTVNLHEATVPARPWVLGSLRLKQWQHFCIVHPEMALTFAVVDVGFMSVAWVQFVDRKTGDRFEHRRQSPFVRTGIAHSLWDEHTYADGRGFAIEIHNHLDRGGHFVNIDVPRQGAAIRADLSCLHDLGAIEPLVVSLPVGRGRAMYSHKVPLPVQGELEAGGYRYTLDPGETTAILDIHKAHYPRRTFWNWVTFAGRVGDARVAVNLTENVIEDDSFHENAVWVDGRLQQLSPAAFDVDSEAWSAGTRDQRVRLDFREEGLRSEDLNYGVIVSRFQQKYGRFDGVVGAGEDILAIDGLWGLFEKHQAVW